MNNHFTDKEKKMFEDVNKVISDGPRTYCNPKDIKSIQKNKPKEKRIPVNPDDTFPW